MPTLSLSLDKKTVDIGPGLRWTDVVNNVVMLLLT
jgi:hypothetical protein